MRVLIQYLMCLTKSVYGILLSKATVRHYGHTG